ncbi:MAG: glycoside hydrolase family 3 C-terminal domain-containing protein, partial [Alistipes sp.]|nr:glycoside hydrolase family 3 C-terminal domain-containing protein [Alistipes sp.]
EWEQAGQTNDSCVAFPALTCLAASWNPEMALIYGESLGEEALYRGKDMILGPGVNICRTPLNGRNFEYMGEDPYLASRMVVPYVKGLQSKGVAACVKHYALNNDEEYRHQVNVIVDDRALHEIYLPAFKAAVEEAKAWAIMGAYNLYKNQHNCHNQWLLNDILKRDWKFDGVVVSDWGGVHNTDEAVKNGLDMEFGTWTNGLTTGTSNAYDNYYLANPYIEGIREGRYTMKELEDKVRRVLRLYYRTTMNRQRPVGFLCSEAHYAAARKIAEEGIVLLQNRNNVLPIDLQNARRILVVGENAIKPMTVGGGSSSLKVQKEISPLEGLRNRLTGTNITVDYQRGYVGDKTSEYNGVKMRVDLSEDRTEEQLIADAVNAAKDVDYVIIFGGLNKSDYQDCEGHDRREYALPYNQDALIAALAAVNERVIYVNISGNTVAMPWTTKVPGIVQGWFIGSEAGEALASVLVGDVNPSGKLPFTWPASLQDVGAHKLNTYPGVWRKGNEIIDEEYKESIYVGYRWADKEKTKPTFAFGHGLSYTTFEYGKAVVDRKVMSADETLTVTVPITNTGDREGAEIVQLYISDLKSSRPRPVKELKGFKKVKLAPGETKNVTFTVKKEALSFFDDVRGEWIAEPGRFEAIIAASAIDLKSKVSFDLR